MNERSAILLVMVSVIVLTGIWASFPSPQARPLLTNVPLPPATHVNGKPIQHVEEPIRNAIDVEDAANAAEEEDVSVAEATPVHNAQHDPLMQEKLAKHFSEQELNALRQMAPHVALIMPSSVASRQPAAAMAAYRGWKEQQLLHAGLGLTTRLYIHAEGSQVWEWEEEVLGHSNVHVRACPGIAVDEEVAQINCLASHAINEGATFICLIDEAEFDGSVEEVGTWWLLRAVTDLLHLDFDPRFYLPQVRHLGVAGRGAQWRSRLDASLPYVREERGAEIREAEARGEEPVILQFKALNQFCQSLCIHRQHAEMMGTMLHPDLSLSDGILWLTALYSYDETHVTLWPSRYGDYSSFMEAMDARYRYNDVLQYEVDSSKLDLYGAKAKTLLPLRGILGCEALDEVEADDFVPASTTHSTKSGISTATMGGEKVFMFQLAQGGPTGRRRTTLKNIHILLMLYESEWVSDLVAYCPTDGRTAVKFIESKGDYDEGSEGESCTFRLRGTIDLVETLKVIHSIGQIQCDWKTGQWIYNEQNKLILVDVDTLDTLPTDCGQAEVRRHPAYSNFAMINEGSKSWNETKANTILVDQFLMLDGNDYPRMDYRHDTYKLGGYKYLHKVLDYHGACQHIMDDVKELIASLRLVYPPSLDEVSERLEEMLVKEEQRELDQN